MVTPPLFAAFPTPEDMAQATPEGIFEYIRSVSYPNNKARHLAGMARMLVEKFHGEVPSEPDELTSLPGVGRKTANVIQSVVFEKAAMAVDTHVFRVSHRLGLVGSKCTTPYSVEKELTRHIPSGLIPKAHTGSSFTAGTPARPATEMHRLRTENILPRLPEKECSLGAVSLRLKTLTPAIHGT